MVSTIIFHRIIQISEILWDTILQYYIKILCFLTSSIVRKHLLRRIKCRECCDKTDIIGNRHREIKKERKLKYTMKGYFTWYFLCDSLRAQHPVLRRLSMEVIEGLGVRGGSV